MQKFQISRRIWLRGNRDTSTLLDERGNSCCVGLYLKSCGVSNELLLNQFLAATIDELKLPARTRWLRQPYNDSVHWLYSWNDDDGITDSQREEFIANLFAKNDVEVAFVD